MVGLGLDGLFGVVVLLVVYDGGLGFWFVVVVLVCVEFVGLLYLGWFLYELDYEGW